MPDTSEVADPNQAAETGAAPAAPARRAPGHRPDLRETIAELTEKAHEIGRDANNRMAGTLRDVIRAATGAAAFAIESVRDLLTYMVRRGQITQEEADRLLGEAESVAGPRRPERSQSPPAPAPRSAPKAAPSEAAPAAAAVDAPEQAEEKPVKGTRSGARSGRSPARAAKAAAPARTAKVAKAPAKATKPASKAATKPAAKTARAAKPAKAPAKTTKTASKAAPKSAPKSARPAKTPAKRAKKR